MEEADLHGFFRSCFFNSYGNDQYTVKNSKGTKDFLFFKVFGKIFLGAFLLFR